MQFVYDHARCFQPEAGYDYRFGIYAWASFVAPSTEKGNARSLRKREEQRYGSHALFLQLPTNGRAQGTRTAAYSLWKRNFFPQSRSLYLSDSQHFLHL